MAIDRLIEADDIAALQAAVIVDCRFSLADPGEGRRLYEQSHIPGARYLDLEHNLSPTHTARNIIYQSHSACLPPFLRWGGTSPS